MRSDGLGNVNRDWNRAYISLEELDSRRLEEVGVGDLKAVGLRRDQGPRADTS